MLKINIYSDDTIAQKKSFIISTFIWGDPVSCRDYKKDNENIVESNMKKKILDNNFKGFHASRLRHSNWYRLSGPYKEVLNKWNSYLRNKHLRAFVYLESRKKYEANTKLIEDTLKEHLQDKGSHLGEIYQNVKREDQIALYKNTHEIYHYILHRGEFGGPNTFFKYYPDSSGRVLEFKDQKFFLQVPGKKNMFCMSILK